MPAKVGGGSARARPPVTGHGSGAVHFVGSTLCGRSHYMHTACCELALLVLLAHRLLDLGGASEEEAVEDAKDGEGATDDWTWGGANVSSG